MRNLSLVIIASAIVASLLALSLAGCARQAEEETTLESETSFVPVVSVTGEVLPRVWATLSPQANGAVLEVLVKPGDEVASGDLLVQLDPADAQLAVQRAEGALEATEAQLALLRAAPRPEEVAVAEAQVKAAQAELSQAEARLAQLKAGAPEAEIAAARAQVTAIQAQQLEAYETHEQTMECYEFTLPDGKEKKVCPLLGPMEERTRYNLQAKNEELEAAQTQLRALIAGKDEQIRAMQAAVQAAAEQRDVLQARLDGLKAGASQEEIAAAEARVAQAEAALAAARVTLEHTEIRAPFAGTVGTVQARESEFVVPGQPLITLGDLNTLRVETTDLDEIDVARVAVGQLATITFDSLPEQTFTGRVIRISPMAESDTGGVNYTAILELSEMDPEIRWGMTAFVDIETER
jgi:HlyD family secretion protein